MPTTEIVDVLQANEVELGSLDGQRLARFLDAYGEDGDPVREEAIGVFVEHYIRAQQWVSTHPRNGFRVTSWTCRS